MWFKGYHLSSMSWSYLDIYSIDYFLIDFKDELTRSNVERNLELLENYRDEDKGDAVTLIFGNCKLDIQGIDEAVATIRGLEYALENCILKNK